LKCIGYDLNPTGDYGYQHTSDPEVISARQSAANELDSLVQYLTAIKTNPPADFKIFIQVNRLICEVIFFFSTVFAGKSYSKRERSSTISNISFT